MRHPPRPAVQTVPPSAAGSAAGREKPRARARAASARRLLPDMAPPAQAERGQQHPAVSMQKPALRRIRILPHGPGTPVDYPGRAVEQDGLLPDAPVQPQKQQAGDCFSLPSADYQTPSRNIAIYGHHLSHSDAMFSSLVQYKDRATAPRTASFSGDSPFMTIGFSPSLNMQVGDWGMQRRLICEAVQAFQAYVDRARAKALNDSGAAARCG